MAQHLDIRAAIRQLIEANRITILVTPTIRDELNNGPDGFPTWFPIQAIQESVFILDSSQLGEVRLGDGTIYSAHKGQSKRIADAKIADAAGTDATIFVTDDTRCRDTLQRLTTTCQCIDLPAFEIWLAAQLPADHL